MVLETIFIWFITLRYVLSHGNFRFVQCSIGAKLLDGKVTCANKRKRSKYGGLNRDCRSEDLILMMSFCKMMDIFNGM
jgi:hypothetical protein